MGTWALPNPLTCAKGRELIYYLEQMTYEDGRQWPDGRQWSNGSRFVKEAHIQIMELLDDLCESAYVRAQYDPRLEPFLNQIETLRTHPLPYMVGQTSLNLRDYLDENVIELELDELGHWVLFLRFYIHSHAYLAFNLYWREPTSID